MMADPHTLKICLVVPNLEEAGERDVGDIIEPLMGYIYRAACLNTPEFYSRWIVVVATSEMLADTGTMLLSGEIGDPSPEPGILESLLVPQVSIKKGNFEYLDLEKTWHTVLGCQLFRLERLIAGSLTRHSDPAFSALHAEHLLLEHIRPFAAFIRGANGDDICQPAGTPKHRSLDRAYRRLRRELATPYLRELYNDPGRGSLKIGRRWLEEGRTLKSNSVERWQTIEIKRELELLNSVLKMIERARDIHLRAARPLASGVLSGEFFGADIAPPLIAALLHLTGQEEPASSPPISAMTELALRYGVNPAPLFPQLTQLEFHFAAAIAIGRAERGGTLELSSLEHWGLKGLHRSVLDPLLDEELAASREALRARVSPDLLDKSEEPTERIILGNWPRARWRHRQSVRRSERQRRSSK